MVAQLTRCFFFLLFPFLPSLGCLVRSWGKGGPPPFIVRWAEKLHSVSTRTHTGGGLRLPSRLFPWLGKHTSSSMHPRSGVNGTTGSTHGSDAPYQHTGAVKRATYS
ncbi:hypothetical protein M431DRAFT_256706 [Trichoderma harzianum CBS 226.95]|uniref:Secreted protein n=1 Tax=Trichoderma harzianum CBS 226.95 TaxID=983964 RepID=A0A2T4A0G6_TRIHA|nr:hypothetical protein M431DRAFT_256706 [Trichoderma harzianum CBS 226.95]PTB50557.1 hypothetical protein M431DRAFT_256706 [Trichoderma harzianum CBS 226.95]